MKKRNKVVTMLWYQFTRTCKLCLAKLPVLIVIATPYLSMWCLLCAYRERGCFRVGGEWFVPVLCCLVAYILHTIQRACEVEVYGCPVARKRFTRRDSRGRIIFKMDDIYEMTEYLAEVEDYCESYGAYRGGRK